LRSREPVSLRLRCSILSDTPPRVSTPAARRLGVYCLIDDFMTLIFLLFVPFLGSMLAALQPTHARNGASSWAAVVALAVAVPLGLLYPEIKGGGVVTERLSWLPSLGLDIVVRVDGFAWLFG